MSCTHNSREHHKRNPGDSVKTLTFLILIVGLVLFVLAVLRQRLSGTGDRGSAAERPRKKPVLSAHEQAMYNRLEQSLPDLNVLAQVSFGALLTAKTRPARNTFDRKIADFVICSKAFEVLAIVELDDSSHRGRADRDASRDALLEQAGYRVVRYAQIPDVDRVKTDFAPATASKPPSAPDGSRPSTRRR